MNADAEHRVVVTSGCAFTEVGAIGLYSVDATECASAACIVESRNGTNDFRRRSRVEREDVSSQPQAPFAVVVPVMACARRRQR